MSQDDLGDRIKSYEAVETGRAFAKGLPIYARIDGRSFSRFTKGMKRPFDLRMTDAMVMTTKGLVADTHARIGYTQSDEISLVWLYEAPESEILFGGKVHKLTSVLASLAAAHFMNALWTCFEHHDVIREALDFRSLAERVPHFDCRVFQLPSKTEAANAVLWRALDARKNAVSMATRAIYSAKDMHGKDQTDMREMLAGKGIDFESYPAKFKWGTFVQRRIFERSLTLEELARIPEKHRPKPHEIVTRSEVKEIPMPDFVMVANREAVIFEGSKPVTRDLAA